MGLTWVVSRQSFEPYSMWVDQNNFLQLTEAKTQKNLKFHVQFVFQKLQHFSFKADEKKIVSELPCMMQNVLYIDK